MINTMALKGAIVSAGHTQRSLAKALNMSENTMNSKVNGKSDFTASEIIEVCRELNIKEDQMKIDIFLSSSSHLREDVSHGRQRAR